MLTAVILAEYRRIRAKHWNARAALRAAKIKVRFRLRDDVRIRHVEDPEPYMFGDAEDEAATRRLIERHGVWGLVAERRCPCCDSWSHVDSCWGFLGNDLEDNGTDIELMQAAMEEADGHRTEALMRFEKGW